MIRLLAASALLVMAVALGSCGNDGPGQVDFHGRLTILNRTVAEVTLLSGQREVTIPACEEATATDFPLNWWELTSPGRDHVHSGGGDYGPASFLIVTDVVTQVDARPDPLPACEGLLQPGS